MPTSPKKQKPLPTSAPLSATTDDSSSLPLHALLSFALVAFTIELDNQFEQRVPHRTTIGKSAGARPDSPWLVSLPMYANYLRFLCGTESLTVSEFKQRANLSREATRMWLTRLSSWWGYLYTERSLSMTGHPDWTVRLTPGGKRACEAWQALLPEIEANWNERFGEKSISRLRQALISVRSRIPGELPEHLSILGYGFVANFSPNDSRVSSETLANLPFSALLAQVLLSFALEFEAGSELSLPLCANALRLLGEEPFPVRDLHHVAGVSKEAMKGALGFLVRNNYASMGRSAGRGPAVRVSNKGLRAREQYQSRISKIELDWKKRFSASTLAALQESLAAIVEDGTASATRLYQGLIPLLGNWRGHVERLPWYPMVLHRGGFPDGA